MHLDEVKIGQAVRWLDHKQDPEYYGIISSKLTKNVIITYTDGVELIAYPCDLEPILAGDHP
jgi:hypothetical protein